MVDFPEQGEIVIGKITKVLNYGVFMDLIEYEGLQGFVHISNVSSSWVKNIRNFVKEGQVRAGKVTNVDAEKKQVDVSLTKVSSNLQRAKIEEYKQAKRTHKLMELFAKTIKTDFDSVWETIAEPLLEKQDSLYDAFQEILLQGDSVLPEMPKPWVVHFKEMLEKNFELPEKTVKGKISISVPGADGVEFIKKALLAGQKKGGKKVEIIYEGSGKYLIKAPSTDYKSAEKLLKTVSDEISSLIKSANGKFEFEKGN